MSKEEKRAPEVRFEGFHDDWKQRKLTNLVSVIKSYPLSRSVETEKNTGVRYIHYGDIHTKRADKITSKSNIPNINVGDYKYLEKDDLALADASEDYQGIAMPSVIVEKTPFRIVAGLHTIALRPKTIEPLYLYYLIHSSTFRKYGYKVGTGMKVFGISKNNILKFETLFPCIEEQTKISSLLNKIDDTIALHQRKLDKLQELKKAALQSLFPQKEETEPKVRFTNFDEPWKHCNLGELVIIRSGFTGDAALNEGKYFLTRIETIASGEINFERVGYTNNKPDNKYLLTAGDILYSNINSLSQIGKVAQYQSRQPLYHGINLLRLTAKDVIDSRFLIQALRTNDKKVWAMSHANPAVNQASINQTELAKQTFVLPNKNEQREIGKFLSDLDDVITLYHKKLENLHELKKSFLQKMFI